MICVSQSTKQIIFEATLSLKIEVGGPFEKHETVEEMTWWSEEKVE